MLQQSFAVSLLLLKEKLQLKSGKFPVAASGCHLEDHTSLPQSSAKPRWPPNAASSKLGA